ncbi:MAG: AAA family ATPase, partial [Leadbetterella sp.]|nr:AAA family ATPase [Leadbetterella sp.]
MLIRFVAENIFSFGDRKEFNMLPRPRLRTLNNHKYSFNGVEVLKLTTIYGANGAGKSNFIKALASLQDIVVKGETPFKLKDTRFKFQDLKQNRSQVLAVEFIQKDQAFYYAVEIADGIFLTEELYYSGLGKSKDTLIFERKSMPDGSTRLNFLEAFEADKKSEIIKSVLLEEFIKPNKSILKLISNRDNKHLNGAKSAYDWFSQTLQIITPDSKPVALADRIDRDSNFKKYANAITASFGLGINALKVERKDVNDFF